VQTDERGRVVETKTEARAGTTPHVARYVLIFGTGLTILLFAIILFVAS
jgi:hypothetical protein